MDPLTLVYVVKEAELNEELRHSLRSVATNWPHAEVTVVGYKPSWVTGVNYIPVAQVKGQKHPNSLRNQRAALTNSDLPETYWSMNDDFFVLASLTNSAPTTYHWGTVDHVLSTYGPDRLGSSYYRSMVATKQILTELGYANPLSYAAHVPMPIHRPTFLSVLDEYNRDDCWIQHMTIVGNLMNLGGTELPHGDVKIYDTFRTQLPEWLDESEYVSTYDMSFERGSIGLWLRRRFAEPCRFEADA